jgi:hypothetical protein
MITKFHKPNTDQFILAMFLMYARAPKQPQPDTDGFYSLGEIGETRSDRGIDRWSPYAPAAGLKPVENSLYRDTDVVVSSRHVIEEEENQADVVSV